MRILFSSTAPSLAVSILTIENSATVCDYFLLTLDVDTHSFTESARKMKSAVLHMLRQQGEDRRTHA